MYACGRYIVKVLPMPGVLRKWISPPSSLAISRLMESPRPVPPYLRLVVPSACRNASQMMLLFIVRDADSGVVHLERDHVASLVQHLVFGVPSGFDAADVQLDTAVFGELQGVGNQVF